jgi:flagellar operon protein
MIEQTNRVDPRRIGGANRRQDNRSQKYASGNPVASSFEDVLRRQRLQQQLRNAKAISAVTPKEAPIAFSKHARQRLDARDIQLGPDQSQRLARAISAASSRGARQSLVVLDGVALVVNVQDRKVVTALEADKGSNKVFTNIDSAVVA